MQIKLQLKHKDKELILICNEKTVERIIDAVYPDKGTQGTSKGYIQLLDFFYK